MINYQQELEKKLCSIGGATPRLLLHCCCAVCSSYVLEYLSRYFDITILFYNPNIFPAAEYEHRKAELVRLINTVEYPAPIEIADCDYSHSEYLEFIKGLESEPEGGARCRKCFELRLRKSAEIAKSKGIPLICTTLTISPHKNASVINELGECICAEYGLEWLPNDFKKKNGYLRANRLAAELEIYRQNYCGCEFAAPNR
ncbi:MAG: epoxyqueuosine reductase QueH [Oscillospiraceae bacterium]